MTDTAVDGRPLGALRAFGLAAAFAPLQAAAHAPYGLWALGIASFVPLSALALRADVSRRYLAAYAGGVLLFLLGCSWLAETSWIVLLLMTFPEALALPLFVLLLRGVRRWRLVPLPLAIAACWSAVEFARAHWPFNGFPWLLLGATTAVSGGEEAPRLAQAAEWVGELGLGFLLALAGGGLAAAARRGVPRAGRWAGLALAVLVPVTLHLYGAARADAPEHAREGGPVVALVQANVPQRLKHAPAPEREIFLRQRELTLDALRSGAAGGRAPIDLVVWAETMYPYQLGAGEPGDVWFAGEHGEYGPADAAELERLSIHERLWPALARRGASLLVGVITHQGRTPERRRTFNAARYYVPAGGDGSERGGAAAPRLAGEYRKTVLVPGGEFVPLRAALPAAVDDLVEGIAGFLPSLTAGEGPMVFELPARDGAAPRRFATTICYENVYAGYHAEVARLAPDFVLNLSNEGWFGASHEFDQMDSISRLRAIESRLPLVRATNTGISAVYDAAGRRASTLLGEDGADRAVAGTLVAPVPLSGSTAPTPFVRMGTRPFAALLGLVAALAFAGHLRERRAGRVGGSAGGAARSAAIV